MRVTAVIVNYNSADDIFECLDSLRASEHPVELVVVDNASTDGSPDQLASLDDVRLVRSARNLGFGGGVNLGVRTVDPDGAILLVNPDATLAPDAVGRLVETLQSRPLAAAVGPLVCNPDGTVQPSKRTFPTWTQAAMHATIGVFWPGNPGTRAYVCADAPEDRPSRVGWLSASVLLVRAEAFRDVGMFDERFFFYVEDLDLCRRFADAGHGSGSSRGPPWCTPGVAARGTPPSSCGSTTPTSTATSASTPTAGGGRSCRWWPSGSPPGSFCCSPG